MAGGRPTTDTAERRNEVATVRLTAAERAALDARAASLGLRVSDYLRAAAIESLPPKLAKATRAKAGILNRDELRELNAIGNNLNQIARALNIGKDEPQGARIDAALSALHTVLERHVQ